MKFGIIFGGQSYEHEISIVSAISLKKVIKKECAYVFCDQDRNFYLIEPKNMIANYFSSGEYKKAKELTIASNGFYVNGMFSKTRVEADVFVNVIHGCDGEDGKLASLLEFFNIPFIGPRLEASVISYDKELTKNLAKAAGIKTIEYQIIKSSTLPNIPYPLIVKPSHLGSSIGIKIVKNHNELSYAIDTAFELDSSAIIEPYIEDVKEYNLAGCKIDGEIEFSIIEEPQKDKFLDYFQKYMDFSRSGKPQEANLGLSVKDNMKEAFRRVYNYGEFDGAIIRCDFFVINNEVYLNEINPNPGSLANYLFNDFNDVLNRLAMNLPSNKHIQVGYELINAIVKNK